MMQLCSVNQRYNLKAIHNSPVNDKLLKVVVFSQSKIQSKSNSQRAKVGSSYSDCCVQSIKDTI